MAPSLYRRMFDRLSDLIPSLSQVAEGDLFFAPARVNDDMALHCVVTNVRNGFVNIELAHDLIIEGEERGAPWMSFSIDLNEHTAELVAIQDSRSYHKFSNAAGHVDSCRIPLHVYAVNWLQVLINMQFAFRPFVNAVATV